jgi:cytidylate kinase
MVSMHSQTASFLEAEASTGLGRARKRWYPAVILGGLAGSGKSTVSAALSKIYGLRRVSAGDIFRAIAKERKTDLIAFGRYAEKHPQIDKEIDKRLLEEAKKGDVILDGRAVAYLSKKARIPALRIFLGVGEKQSAKRVAKRDGITPKKALAYSRLREREIARRLKSLYGLDTSDTSNYDVCIQTDGYTPKEVIGLIAQLVKYGRS